MSERIVSELQEAVAALIVEERKRTSKQFDVIHQDSDNTRKEIGEVKGALQAVAESSKTDEFDRRINELSINAGKLENIVALQTKENQEVSAKVQESIGSLLDTMIEETANLRKTIDDLAAKDTTNALHDKTSEISEAVSLMESDVVDILSRLEKQERFGEANSIAINEDIIEIRSELNGYSTVVSANAQSVQLLELKEQFALVESSIIALSDYVEKSEATAEEKNNQQVERVNLRLEELAASIKSLDDNDKSVEIEHQLSQITSSIEEVQAQNVSMTDQAATKVLSLEMELKTSVNDAFEELQLLKKTVEGITSSDDVPRLAGEIKDLSAKVLELGEKGQQAKLDASEIKRQAEKQIDDRYQAIAEKIDSAIEIARLDANLWKETTKHKLGDIDARLNDAYELVDELTAEVESATSKNKMYAKEMKAAVEERIEHVGGYRKGETYRKGQCVGRDGATFMCVVKETSADPRERTEWPHWRLMSSRGEKGDRGDSVRGEKGDKGAPGKKGDDGVSFVGVEMVGTAIVLASSDGRAHKIDIGNAVNALIDKQVEEKIRHVNKQANK